jgi:hypothetical protein
LKNRLPSGIERDRIKRNKLRQTAIQAFLNRVPVVQVRLGAYKKTLATAGVFVFSGKVIIDVLGELVAELVARIFKRFLTKSKSTDRY